MSAKMKDAELNGRNFPAKELLSVFWSCGTKGGQVPADKFTANVARITVDKSVFSSLAAADDGKDIVFTVKGCYNKATKTAVVKYVQPTATITKVRQEGQTADDTIACSAANLITVTGANFQLGTGDGVQLKWTDMNGDARSGAMGIESSTATSIVCAFSPEAVDTWQAHEPSFSVPMSLVVTSHGGTQTASRPVMRAAE